MIDVRRVTLKNEYQNSASLSPILRAINSASLIEQKIAVPEKGRKKMAKLSLRRPPILECPGLLSTLPWKLSLRSPMEGEDQGVRDMLLLGEEKATSNQLLNMESMEIPLKTGRIENQEAGQIFLLNQSP